MKDASLELDLLLNRIEENCDPASCGKNAVEFMVDCLSLVEHKMPTIAKEALRVARGYPAERATLDAVVEMLDRCWLYLDEQYRGKDLSDPEVSAIRAAIFILFDLQHPEEFEIVDSLSFFLRLVNNIERHLQEEESLLRVHFAGCL